MEPKIGAEAGYSVCVAEEPEMSIKVDEGNVLIKHDNVGSVSDSSCLTPKDGSLSKREDFVDKSSAAADKRRKSKYNPGKRKGKVDWTPELHKQFVQAVEQLGLDKAVPSKILELMGIDCLTRHNVASHLQKYRSHQKHLLAREAEAANWNRRRQAYGTVGAIGKKDRPSCVPTTGFPPVTPMPHFRPLHVWGHPLPHQSLMHMWSKPPPHPRPPILTGDTSSYWYYHHQDVPAPGVPCSLPQFLPTGYPPPSVPGIPPTYMHNVDTCVGFPAVFNDQVLPQPPSDFQLSKESIDTAIGDVLSKPWLPLPLGLKPPSTDSVLTELQRQGISRIRPDLYLAS